MWTGERKPGFSCEHHKWITPNNSYTRTLNSMSFIQTDIVTEQALSNMVALQKTCADTLTLAGSRTHGAYDPEKAKTHTRSSWQMMHK